MRKPPSGSGAFSTALINGMESELGHQLPLVQGNDGYRPARRGIISCRGNKSACLPGRQRYGHWHGANNMSRSFANQLHQSAYTELCVLRRDMEFYLALGNIMVGRYFIVVVTLHQPR